MAWIEMLQLKKIRDGVFKVLPCVFYKINKTLLCQARSVRIHLKSIVPLLVKVQFMYKQGTYLLI